MKVPFISFPNTSVFKGISKGRKGLGFKDGNLVLSDHEGNETVISSDTVNARALVLTGDLRAARAVSHYVKLLDLNRLASVYPHGITITSWYIDCLNSEDPTTELTKLHLKYCVAPTDAQTFADVNTEGVLVDELATMIGNKSCVVMSGSDLGSGIIPALKVLYLHIEDDPTDMNIIWSLTINFTANQS